MATKEPEGRRWTLDDGWWADPLTVREFDDENTQTLWADDTQAWDEEAQTLPDVNGGDPLPVPPPAPQPASASSKSIP
jgi:hypothetical protein